MRRLFLKCSLGLWISEACAKTITTQSGSKWQLSPQLVAQGASKKYRVKVGELQQAYLLDTDVQLTERLQRIMTKLAYQAAIDYRGSGHWQWEIHSSDQHDESSYSMAGGKIMISKPQVNALALNETELAMLIAHEMAHSLLLHNFVEDQEALRLFPAWLNQDFEEFETAIDDDDTLVTALAALGKQQEFEADLGGMELALKAGYPAKNLMTFFEKLKKRSAYPNFESRSHPAPAERLQRLRDWFQQQAQKNNLHQ